MWAPNPACGHPVLLTDLHTIVTCAGCELSACAPCAISGHAAELIGEGPLHSAGGVGQVGPVWIERVKPFFPCAKCDLMFCNDCPMDYCVFCERRVCIECAFTCVRCDSSICGRGGPSAAGDGGGDVGRCGVEVCAECGPFCSNCVTYGDSVELATCEKCQKSWCKRAHGKLGEPCSTCDAYRCGACSSGACGPIRTCASCFNDTFRATCEGLGCELFKTCKLCGLSLCNDCDFESFVTCDICNESFCIEHPDREDWHWHFCAACPWAACGEHGAWPLCEAHEQRCESEACGGPFSRCHACHAPLCKDCDPIPCTSCEAGCCNAECAALRACAAGLTGQTAGQKRARSAARTGAEGGGGGGGGAGAPE